MSRTPRQQQGEGLVPVTVMIPPELKGALTMLAAMERRSLSAIARLALEAYVDTAERARDVSAG